ncbi:MAG: ATP synthase subunit I [Leptolyngbyaceae cyanobacterium MAG.088]|nr:ATP synthase subunit I [Leptolyngbyaceae cyanobacterium MAG.088]
MEENDGVSESSSETLVSVEISSEPNSSMEEYYQLQNELLLLTLGLMLIAFISVWVAYSLNTSLNYLMGASVGVIYLKLLARSVEQLGRSKSKVGKNQLALFIGLIVVATQVEQLQIVPIFLGFLTYKAAIIAYMFKALSKAT